MLERARAGLLAAGCLFLFMPGGQTPPAETISDDRDAPPVARCSPTLRPEPLAAPGDETPPDLGAYIDCLRATGYGSRS